MLASEDFRYAAPRVSSPWPAIVREPVGAQPAPTTIFAASGVSPHSIPAPSCPEPGQDGDEELFLLGERIADLAARINAAESRMMTLIADFDRRGGWKDGFSSCAEWLAWRIGIKIGAARERVRTARALEDLPRTADALREGSISYAKVRAITRVATPGSEADLLEFARAGSAAKLEQTVRIWRKLSREGELTAEEARHRSRTFSVFVDGDGMYVAKGRLEPEAGAVLMRAVEAASDALFRREEGADDARDTGDVRPEPKQRRADAVGLLAERALAAGFGAASVATPAAPLTRATTPAAARAPLRATTRASRAATRANRTTASATWATAWATWATWTAVCTTQAVARTTYRRLNASSPAPGQSATRSWSTATPRRWQRKESRGARTWTGSAFSRKRRGAWRATPQWSPWSTRKTGPC